MIFLENRASADGKPCFCGVVWIIALLLNMMYCKIMKKLMKLLVISWLLVVFLLLPTAHYLLPTTQAQEGGIETTYTFEIKDGGAIDGDILISTDQGLIRANKSYDNKLFGILQTKPLMVYKSDNSTDLPVQRSGVARVNVVTSNGPISYGDFITSSTTPGKGQKAS